MISDVVIVDAVRVASGRGKRGGALAHLHPVELLAQVIRPLVQRSGVDPSSIDDMIVGCLAQVGEQSVNIARNAVLAAGLPETVPGTTVDRQCGSSLQAATFAAAGLAAGIYDTVIAAGVEMMSKFGLNYATVGQDPFGPGVLARYSGGLVGQGISAELVAARYRVDRQTLDEFAVRSHQLAARATEAGLFDREIVAVAVPDGSGGVRAHRADETIRATTTVDALGGLANPFASAAVKQRFPQIDAWRITAGNASPFTDAASAVLLTTAENARRQGLRPRARFVDVSVVGSDPIEMLTGIIPATEKVLKRSGLTIDEIDAYEINEAFAPVPLVWLRHFGADPDKLNIRGGAIALGHALGATGTRLITTLVNALESTGGRYGLIAVCEGQGMANAAVIERIDA